MARQTAGLRPPTPAAVAAVPSTSRRRTLWRACGRTHPQPWFYTSRDTASDPGRFDLPTPRGTCYWAVSAAAAIIEATADPDGLDPPAVAIADLARLRVWSAERVPQARRMRLADTTVASTRTLTSEISTIVPYDLPWAWADAFHADGRLGICYTGRFSHDDSVALFGPAGIPADSPAASPSTAASHYDDLPDGFKAHIDVVGPADRFAPAPPPR